MRRIKDWLYLLFLVLCTALFGELIDWSYPGMAAFALRLVPVEFILPAMLLLAVLYIVFRKLNLRFLRYI